MTEKIRKEELRVDKKLLVCIAIIIVLAGIVLFFILRDFGVFGGRGFRSGFNLNEPGGFNSQDPSVFMPRIKEGLGLPADATDEEVKSALNLPEDANFDEIRSSFMQRMRAQPQGGN